MFLKKIFMKINVDRNNNAITAKDSTWQGNLIKHLISL